MKKFHIIVDFSYLYYRYFFKLKQDVNKKYGIKKLTSIVDGVEVETTYMYHIGKDIESFIEQLYNMAGYDNEITVSICFDSKSERKDEDAEYKAKREHRLGEEDFNNMRNLMKFFGDIGYNIYKEEGKEADDLVYSLVELYKNDYDLTIIYTPDKDLMVNICDNVGVMRSNTSKSGYDVVYKKNYERYLSEKLKCRIKYNSILLYLSMVGDTVDGIKGIKGFGPKAFDKFVNMLENAELDFEKLSHTEEVKKVIISYEEDYKGKNENALDEALRSLEMAKSRLVEVEKPVKKDTKDSRNAVYAKFGMKSLMDKE